MVTNTPKKRDAILAQAIVTFAEQGFRNADVQVIADRAGVGKGTVYRHFGNKEDLFWATVYAVLERLGDSLVVAMQTCERPFEQLRAAGIAYGRFFEENPAYIEVFAQDRAEFRGSTPETHVKYHEELVDRFAAVLQRAIACGEARPVDVRETIVALASALYGCVMYGSYVRSGITPTEMTRRTVDTILAGLAVPTTGG